MPWAERSKPMNPVDYIIITVIVVIVALAGLFVYKSKKSGKKCIGCPDGCACGESGGCSGCGGNCSCGK